MSRTGPSTETDSEAAVSWAEVGGVGAGCEPLSVGFLSGVLRTFWTQTALRTTHCESTENPGVVCFKCVNFKMFDIHFNKASIML